MYSSNYFIFTNNEYRLEKKLCPQVVLYYSLLKLNSYTSHSHIQNIDMYIDINLNGSLENKRKFMHEIF